MRCTMQISPVFLTIIHSLNVHCSMKSQKFTISYFWILRSFKVIDVGTSGKVISSACYRI